MRLRQSVRYSCSPLQSAPHAVNSGQFPSVFLELFLLLEIQFSAKTRNPFTYSFRALFISKRTLLFPTHVHAKTIVKGSLFDGRLHVAATVDGMYSVDNHLVFLNALKIRR